MDIHPVCNLSMVSYVGALVPGKDTKQDWMLHFIHRGLEAFKALLAGFEQAPFAAGNSPVSPISASYPDL